MVFESVHADIVGRGHATSKELDGNAWLDVSLVMHFTVGLNDAVDEKVGIREADDGML